MVKRKAGKKWISFTTSSGKRIKFRMKTYRAVKRDFDRNGIF